MSAITKWITVLAAGAALAVFPSAALARYGSSSVHINSGSPHISSGGVKTAGGTKVAGSSVKSAGGTKYANGAPKPSRPTFSKPSTGSVAQPAPVTRLVPAALPRASAFGGRSAVVVPSGRSYSYDRSYLVGHPRYADPYNGLYFGSYNSSLYYLWLSGVLYNNRSQAPLPPRSDLDVDQSLVSYLGLVTSAEQLVAAKQ